MADPVDVEHTNLTTAASLGRPDGTDATRDREEMSASSDGPSAAVASNSSVVDVEVLAQLLAAIQAHPQSSEPIIDYCGDYTCTPETCTDMSDDDRARSRAWTAFNKATPTLVASLLAELESVRGELRLHQQQRAAKVEELMARHWLVLAGDGKHVVAGCNCGFRADFDRDSGYGDSVVEHLFRAALGGIK